MNLRGNDSSAPAQRSNSDAYTARRALGDDERSGLLLLGTSACEATRLNRSLNRRTPAETRDRGGRRLPHQPRTTVTAATGRYKKQPPT